MKGIKYLLILLLFVYTGCGCKKAPQKGFNPDLWKDGEVVEKLDHPRLLLFTGEEKDIKRQIEKEPVYQRIHSWILKASDEVLNARQLERKVVGGRLLAVSSEFLKRVFYLSYSYRMTGDKKYLERAEKEMLTVADFSDWHPKHFLDVAEMTMGMAIGYDWLYGELSAGVKEKLRKAIVEKGLKPSEKYGDWAERKNNWNQVCNASMAFGAIAVHDFYPELSARMLSRAYRTLSLPMKEYSPDGVYVEGYGYWNYGTSFNILFLEAVQKYLKDDQGLSKDEGFLKTGEFMKHILTPTALPYNWSDNPLNSIFSPAMIWLAGKSKDKSLLWSEKLVFEKSVRKLGDRLLPAAMIYGRNVSFENIKTPEKTCYFGRGNNPVALMRSSWTTEDALFLGFKLGSPSIPHGHMDVGSFIMEADGVRWAEDPGREEYQSVEKYGNIWKYDQDAFRWKIFRLNSFSHNLITVDGMQQRAEGAASLGKTSYKEDFKYAVSELSDMYLGQLAGLSRGVALVKNSYVLIRDEFKALSKETVLRWAIFTSADVNIKEKEAELTFKGKKLTIKVKGSGNISMKTWSAEPVNEWDAPNPGKKLVGFECKIAPGTEGAFEVLMIPEKSAGAAVFLDKALSLW